MRVPTLLFGLSLIAGAQVEHITPFTGTWKLDIAKSRFQPEPPFKSFTLTFAPDGTRHLDLLSSDGRKVQVSLPWSDGREVAVTANGGFENVTAVSKIEDDTFRDTWKQNGRVIERVRAAVSPDRSTLTIRVDGTDARGGPFHNRLTFQKQHTPTARKEASSMLFDEDVQTVSPALEKYMRGPLSDLWRRPQLSLRDRSIVTLAALIARNQAGELPPYAQMALDNGVQPAEISEITTHLAFYSGWPNAASAASAIKDVFRQRAITANQLLPAMPDLLPIDERAEAQRAARVGQDFGAVAPGVVQYTTEVLVRDLWLRPGLAPRDRSLVTVSALIASGQVAQIPYHLNKAMDNGLTRRKLPRSSHTWRFTPDGRTCSRRFPSPRVCSRGATNSHHGIVALRLSTGGDGRSGFVDPSP